MDITALAPYLAGPGAGLLVCVLVGFGLYKFASTKIMPLATEAAQRHFAYMDATKAHMERFDERLLANEQALVQMRHEITQEHRAIVREIQTLVDTIDREVTNPGVRSAVN